MFGKTIELTASKQEFLFTLGLKESRFRPVVYLSTDQKIPSVGAAPTEGIVDQEVRVFESEGSVDSFAILEAMMRYGLRDVLGSGFFIGPLTLKISIGVDIRQDLKGFAPAVFHQAATHAGAGKIVIQ